MSKLKDIVFETEKYWVLKVSKGYEIYRIEVTHSVRCAVIGWKGKEGLKRSIAEIKQREAS